jgi:hypothetical protein
MFRWIHGIYRFVMAIARAIHRGLFPAKKKTGKFYREDAVQNDGTSL